uniref:Putative secreted peptide n=1 Tax=Anopheles braziliensis TaxID=58242 RepID=A0A2M3ZVK0_9DIPT
MGRSCSCEERLLLFIFLIRYFYQTLATPKAGSGATRGLTLLRQIACAIDSKRFAMKRCSERTAQQSEACFESIANGHLSHHQETVSNFNELI